jgi:hypothetical protein
MNDDVPSCGNLLTMEADHFADAPAHTVAYYRAAEGALDAEAEAALRQIVRFRENGKKGIGTALAMAVNGVEIRFANKSSGRRIGTPGATRA